MVFLLVEHGNINLMCAKLKLFNYVINNWNISTGFITMTNRIRYKIQVPERLI